MSDQVSYTARNSERFASRPAPDYGAASKYLPNALTVARTESRQQRITRARTLREVARLEQRLHVKKFGTPYECGCQHLLDHLRGVREAPNVDLLFTRDRTLAGLIAGAHVFQAITLTDCDRLHKLRDNAFYHRQMELLP